jgi:hypothetical protein
MDFDSYLRIECESGTGRHRIRNKLKSKRQ